MVKENKYNDILVEFCSNFEFTPQLLVMRFNRSVNKGVLELIVEGRGTKREPAFELIYSDESSRIFKIRRPMMHMIYRKRGRYIDDVFYYDNPKPDVVEDLFRRFQIVEMDFFVPNQKNIISKSRVVDDDLFLLHERDGEPYTVHNDVYGDDKNIYPWAFLKSVVCGNVELNDSDHRMYFDV